jgi:hypothetical protein
MRRDAMSIRRTRISDMDFIISPVNKTTGVETRGVYQDLVAYDLREGTLGLRLAAETKGQIVDFVIITIGSSSNFCSDTGTEDG